VAAAGFYIGYAAGVSTLCFGSTTLTTSIVAGNYAKNGNSDLAGPHSPIFLGLNIVGVGSDTDASDHVINTASLVDLFAATVTIDPGFGSPFDAGALDDNGGGVPTVAIKQG